MGLAVAWLHIFWAGNQANMSRLPRKQDTLVIAAGVQAVQRPENQTVKNTMELFVEQDGKG